MSHMEKFQHLKIQLKDIQSATNNFSNESFIGHGGFGKVYKGELVHSKGESTVALKRLDRASKQGGPEFWKEVMMLPLYTHENIISLLGYCDDHGEKIVVYEYASKKSLDAYLASDELTWVQRLKICIGAARGLAYLHTPAETQLRIVHRDIKSSNILLDDNWNAKISDFGLSKFAPANNQLTFVVTNPAGTLGYIDPLYYETGVLTKESDVYSFGVVLFEVLCGRLCHGNPNLKPLTVLVREYYDQNKISELVYCSIKDEINTSSLKLFADVAYQCLKRKREKRPLMTRIVSVLESALYFQRKADAKENAVAGVHRAGILHVKVLEASEFYSSKHYLVLCIDYTNAWYNQVTVKWNEECTIYVENLDYQTLSIIVMSAKSTHQRLGEATMELGDLVPEIPVTCNLDVRGEKDRHIGNLKVEACYKPLAHDHHIRSNTEDTNNSVQKVPVGTPKDGGLFVILIREAFLKDMTPWFFKPTNEDTSVRPHFRGDFSVTMSRSDANSLLWLQDYTYLLERPPTNLMLQLEIYDSRGPGRGTRECADISIAEVVNKKRTYNICKMEPGYSGDGTLPETIYLQVELQWRTSG